MLEVVNLVKTYQTKKSDTVYALNNVSIQFPETGLVFLLGKSGSGKSTLLNAIGGLDKFDSGEIIIKGKSSKEFSQSDFDSYRNTFIGFIFQEYNILENFSVAKNLALALELQGKKASKEEIDRLLTQVDMLTYANRMPNQLSGGQKQRVAIARALIKNPEIIMADEPTGALDSNTGKQVMDTLKELSKTKLVIIVSHDREFAEIYGDRIIELKDGVVIKDVTKKEVISQETPSGIRVIDNNLIYIKRGQNISDADIQSLAKIIKKKSQSQDMFLSFDDKANDKLKEGASINESGNKEQFLQTEKEDINAKTYNGKDLKLIKSHLKFSDSFKMGASSLKTKVGKLIFTIILSLFAFTVFGVVDTFSTWDRATSVYQGIKMSNEKVLIAEKEKLSDGYNSMQPTTLLDIENLRNKYTDYTFKPVYKTNNFGSNYLDSYHNLELYASDESTKIELKATNNPAWAFSSTGVMDITSDDLTTFGFSLSQGRLPQTHEEIAITTHLWDCVKHNTTDTPTDFTGLKIRINNNYYSIVGLVDTHVNLDKYLNLSDQQLAADRSVGNNLGTSLSHFLFINNADTTTFMQNGGSSSYYFVQVNGISSNRTLNCNFLTLEDYYKASFYYDSDPYNELENKKYFVEQSFEYFKGGVDKVLVGSNFVTLGQNEIIVNSEFVSDISNYEDLIDNDSLILKLYEDYDFTDSNLVKEYKVVGLFKNYNNYVVGSQDVVEYANNYFSGVSLFATSLNGSNDEHLIKSLETYDENNIRFTIQNSSTSTFDMFENIILTSSTVFFYVAIAFAVFASLLLMNFISTSIAHKKREIGVLRALGARGGDIFGIFLNESTIISLINFALSSIATYIICKVTNALIIRKLGANLVLLNFGVRQLILILAISWGTAFLASLIPSIKISKKRPIDAINNR